MLDALRPWPLGFAALMTTAALLIALPLGLGFLGHLHPAFDTLAHFRIHIAALLILLGLLSGMLRMLAIGSVAAAAGIGAIWITFGGFGAAGPANVQADPTPPDGANALYRLLHLNLRYNNPTPERVLSMIGEVRPDILMLTEVSRMWEERLARIVHAYPHHLICPPPTPIGGVAILSRRPFEGNEPTCYERGALAVAGIDLGGRRLDVAALHLGWPWPFDQHRRAPHMTEVLSGLQDSVIVAGDFNAAPWSWTVRSMAGEAGLLLVAGVRPSWLFLGMPDFLRRHVGLPIDHILVKGAAITHAIRPLGDVGSDHLPILYEFSLRPAERSQEVMRASLGE